MLGIIPYMPGSGQQLDSKDIIETIKDDRHRGFGHIFPFQRQPNRHQGRGKELKSGQ